MSTPAEQIMNRAGQRMQLRMADTMAREGKLRDIQAESLIKAITSGNLSDEEAENAWGEISKIYSGSKGSKDIIGKAREIMGGLRGFIKPPPQQQEQIKTQAQQVLGGLSGGEGSYQDTPAPSIPPPPSMGQIVAKTTPNAETVKIAGENRANTEWDRRQTTLHKYNMEMEAARAAVQKEIEGMRADAKANAPKTIRPIAAGQLSVSDARLLAKQGREIMDEAGNPIPLDELPDDMGLKPFTDGTRIFYTHYSPNQRVVTVGGKVYAVNPMEVASLTQGGGTELGNAQTGSTTTREQITIDPATGAPTITPLQSTRTPVTPGVRQTTPATPVSTTPATTPASTPGAGNAQPAPAQRPPAPTTPARGDANQTFSDNDTIGIPDRRTGRIIGMTPGMYNQAINRVTPVREASNQLFGDPTQPNFKSLKDYAKIADDPEASKRLANAVRLTFDGIDQQEKSHGSIVNLLKLYGGVPQSLVAAEAAAVRDTINKLKPEEQQAYNTIMSAYGTIVGLRSLTKASAAQFSIRRLEQELPIPGFNSNSSKDFYDKLSRLAQEVYGGTRTIPEGVMSKQEKEYYKNQVDELLRLSKGTAITRPRGASGGASSGRIRVKLANGQTGSVDVGDFDPSTMTKLDPEKR